MDDRLQRRLRDADPLSAGDGLLPDAARLDAIKEQIMQTEQRPVRAALRPRAIGLVAVGALGLAAVLVAGTLLRPGTATLAWEPTPTPVSDADKAAAYAACTENVGAIGGGTIEGLDGVGGRENVPDQPSQPSQPAAPTSLPPLVSLELHGNGGVAVLADDATVGYCLLKREGDGFVPGGLMLGAARPSVPGGSVEFMMSTAFEDTEVGVIGGFAPDGVVAVRIEGGPGDGGVATVTDGRFAIWIPGTVAGEGMEAVALDAAGNEVFRQTLFSAGERPIEGEASPAP